jgi:AcrR family transcriptional regulator
VRAKAPDQTVRKQVLAAAVDLFAANGYDGTSVQQIVERAGVTKGALYHYFTAKEDILLEIYTTVFDEQMAALDDIIAMNREPEWTLREIIHSLIGVTAANVKVSAVFSREATRMDQTRWAALQDRWRGYQESVRAVIRRGQSDGSFATVASPEMASWAIFGVTTSLHTWYRPDGPKTPQQLATELSDLVLAGLAPR